MNTHETYCSLETCKLLKQAGFDWKTFTVYIGEDESLLYRYSENVFNWNIPRNDYEKEGSDNLFYSFINQKDTADFYSAPTLSVAQKWLREMKGIEIEVQRYRQYYHPLAIELFESVYDKKVEQGSAYSVNVLDENEESLYDAQGFFTYEEALEAGIKKALELILEE